MTKTSISIIPQAEAKANHYKRYDIVQNDTKLQIYAKKPVIPLFSALRKNIEGENTP